MPLLQHYLATELGVQAGQVLIGMYVLSLGRHESISFLDGEISADLKDARRLSKTINSHAASARRKVGP
jgi:hypothetical protein